MKNDIAKVAFLVGGAVLLASQAAPAKLILPTVGNYNAAGTKAFWEKASGEKVPAELLQNVAVANASRALQAPYNNIYLQNDRFIVCYGECNTAQPFTAVQGSTPADAVINYDPNAGFFTSTSNEQTLKTTNVYYWVNRLMDEMATVGFKPLKRLLTRVDRDVQNPSSGAAFKDNAFFNDKDWTLSFLPVKSGGMFSKAKYLSPSLDPSVGMHETMHSVFQQAIGPILNKEVYGLHEAFADYFALETLNDSRLGLIFGRGESLRKNETVIQYKTGMESHQLGNVVSSALWKIRGILNDRQVSKTLAFRTIQALGRSPYIAAGDVAQLHMSLAKDMGLPADVQSKIAAVWAESNLKPAMLDVSRMLVPSNFSSAGYFSLTVSTTAPPAIVQQWGLPAQEMARVSFLGISPLNENQIWYNATVEREGKAPFVVRALIAKDTGSVLSSFDGNGKLIEAGNANGFDAVKVLSENLSEAAKWQTNGHKMFVDIFKGEGTMGSMFKASNITQELMTVKINGQPVAVIRQSCDVAPKLWVSLLVGALAGGDSVAALSTLNGLAVYSVESAKFPNLQSLEVSPGRRLVGFSMRTTTGVVQSSMLSGFDPNNQTLGATSPMR